MYHDHIPQEKKTPQIKALLMKFCNVSFSSSWKMLLILGYISCCRTEQTPNKLNKKNKQNIYVKKVTQKNNFSHFFDVPFLSII